MDSSVGLTSIEAKALLAQYGPNSIDTATQNSKIRLLLRQFKSPIILILFAATIVSIFVGEITDGVIILAIIIPSGLLGFWQENRAGKTMQTLMRRVQVYVEVVRDGAEIKLPIMEIVVGDLVLLRIGDLVPADLRVVKAEGLMVDESTLTGESFPREKSVGDIDSTKPLGERASELFFGTHVVSGMGQGVVVKSGKNTEFGALSREVNSRDVTTGFERGITAFGKLLLYAMLGLLSALFIINILLNRPLLDSLLFSLALAVGITPQLLPVIISVSLATGARRMAEKQVLVKRLDAIEDFGIMTVLCTDKTGTITAGVVNLDGALDVNGSPNEEVLRLAYLNAKLQRGFANPLDAAIIESVGNKFADLPVLDEVPYDFERRRLSVLVKDSEPRIITKGAFKSVLDVCSQARSGSGLVNIIGMSQKLADQFEKLSAKGNRVLAVATKVLPGETKITSSNEAEMIFEGLLVFQDPPKVDAREAIQELESLGIELYLITGDSRLAAKSIALQVGLKAETVLTGVDLSKLDEKELTQRVKDCQVFAEVDPIQKERIILALRSGGATVGYFGDGINDAAALHAADVGISVDTAVDVAKNAASIVLLDKDLRVIAEGVRLGRRTFVNTMKYVRVGISAAFGNVVSMAIADVFLPFLPLLPTQILLLNFMTDFPAVSISADSVDPEAVEQPRAWDIESIRKFMILFGLLSSAFDIVTFLVLRLGFHASVTEFRSGWFVESTLTELTVMLVLRTKRPFWRSRPGKGLLISSAILASLTILLPFTAIGRVIGLSTLTAPILLILFVLICAYISLNEFAKRHWMH
ncbi:MAG: magnesium-translocating P-type ATPase [Actinobacteria bacterium]|nr:magnesium-translocating P-type ATPase [Actinomycetota bacterium]